MELVVRSLPSLSRKERVSQSRDNDLSRAEAENDAGAVAEVVLAVAGTVCEFCQEVFGLEEANREVFGDFEINASACAHGEGVLGRVDDGAASSEQDVGEWRGLAVAAKISGAEHGARGWRKTIPSPLDSGGVVRAARRD